MCLRTCILTKPGIVSGLVVLLGRVDEYLVEVERLLGQVGVPEEVVDVHLVLVSFLVRTYPFDACIAVQSCQVFYMKYISEENSCLQNFLLACIRLARP